MRHWRHKVFDVSANSKINCGKIRRRDCQLLAYQRTRSLAKSFTADFQSPWMASTHNDVRQEGGFTLHKEVISCPRGLLKLCCISQPYPWRCCSGNSVHSSTRWLYCTPSAGVKMQPFGLACMYVLLAAHSNPRFEKSCLRTRRHTFPEDGEIFCVNATLCSHLA